MTGYEYFEQVLKDKGRFSNVIDSIHVDNVIYISLEIIKHLFDLSIIKKGSLCNSPNGEKHMYTVNVLLDIKVRG